MSHVCDTEGCDIMFDIGKIESKIEKQESKVEEIEQERESNEYRREIIEKGLAKVKDDKELLKALESNQKDVERVQKKLDKKVEKCVEELQECANKIDKEMTQISNERGTLSELELMGEDVSEAKDILTNRENQLEEKKNEIKELAERLGATISDNNAEGGSGSGKKSFKDRCVEVLVCVEMMLNLLNPAGDALIESNTPKEFPQDRPATVQKAELPKTLEDALIDLGQYLEHLPDEIEYESEAQRERTKEQAEKAQEAYEYQRKKAKQKPLD